MPQKFNVLSIDGGGLKGLIAIKILQVIETITGAPTGDQFDLLAGTSTGGLISCALSATSDSLVSLYNLEDIERLYLQVAQDIFNQGGSVYGGEEAGKLEQLLRKTFGSQRLSAVSKPVFIPTFDLNKKKLVVFKTRTAKKDISRDVSLVQVCRATSAISPVFPPYTMLYHGRSMRCEDAGTHLKNPALCALAEVWKHREYYGRDLKEKDIVMLSVSTGSYRKEGADWSTDIRQVMNSQRMDMDYIRSEKLDIDFEKVNYLRVDMNLDGSSFSLEQLLTWLSRIRSLSQNQKFRTDIYKLLVETS